MVLSLEMEAVAYLLFCNYLTAQEIPSQLSLLNLSADGFKLVRKVEIPWFTNIPLTNLTFKLLLTASSMPLMGMILCFTSNGISTITLYDSSVICTIPEHGVEM